MSRQEVYAWASLLSNVAFLLVYLAVAFGIPGILESQTGNLTTVLLWILFIDLVFQVVISLQQRSALRIDKDERDLQIEAKGFKVGYYVFMTAIVMLVGHLFIQDVIQPFADPVYLDRMATLPLHFLVVMLIAGTSAKSVVQIKMYRTNG